MGCHKLNTDFFNFLEIVHSRKRVPEEKKRVNLFNFTINYNDPQNGATALFNGNISETKWKTASDNVERSYKYEFDALSRITSAIDNTTDKRYSLTNVSYDKMGNITNLSRNGHLNIGATNFGLMDNLTYSYDNGNKLLKIADAAPIDQFGFKDDAVNTATDTANDYTYDANGNMLTDANKGITSNIIYNHLSLPTQINVGGQVINYTYDATGIKLKKVTNGVTTEYAGNYRYVGGELKDFPHAEGYVKNDNGTFNYVYSYKDHLGNVRINYSDLNNDGVIQAATEILDEKNYYVFGGTHEGYNRAINGAYYPFGYNGKEENDENGLATLDFGARNYDKWAGRWMNLDPLAEDMRRHSPYNYAFDNPVYFVDPDGMKPLDWIKNLKTGEVKWYDSKGDKAIEEAARNDGEIGAIESLSESAKGKYKNLGETFFGTKGDNLSDNAQIKEQQEGYITEVSGKLNKKAGVDFDSEKLSSNHGNITKTKLKEDFMGVSKKSETSKKGSIVGDIVQGEIEGRVTETIGEKVFKVPAKATGIITTILTTTPMGTSDSKEIRNKRNAVKAYRTKVKPLITPGVRIKVSQHQY